jgi:hypothetical protein
MTKTPAEERKRPNARRKGKSRSSSPRSGGHDLGIIYFLPPVLPGEREEDYHTLFDGLERAIDPSDLVEKIWVRDVADLIWESWRVRRVRTLFLKNAQEDAQAEQASKAIGAWARPFGVPDPERQGVLDRLLKATKESEGRDERTSTEEFYEGLKRAGMIPTFHPLKAQTSAYVASVESLKELDKIILALDRRRVDLLAEIERRRMAIALRMKVVIDLMYLSEEMEKETLEKLKQIVEPKSEAQESNDDGTSEGGEQA